MSISELEDKVGVYRGYFSRVYSTSIKKIGLDVLTATAKILGTTVDTLMDMDCEIVSADAVKLNDFLIKLAGNTCIDEAIWKRRDRDSLETILPRKRPDSSIGSWEPQQTYVIVTWEPFPDSPLGIIRVSFRQGENTDVTYDSERDNIPAITKSATRLYEMADENSKRPHMDPGAKELIDDFLNNRL